MWPLLAPGGRLVYASCSALRAENADVVGSFAMEHPDARDVTSQSINRLRQHEPGLDVLVSAGSQETGFRIPVGTAAMDGFYYACLEKIKG
jgi:16S rRNA (cytosine967-C5)-methyltransferase